MLVLYLTDIGGYWSYFNIAQEAYFAVYGKLVLIHHYRTEPTNTSTLHVLRCYNYVCPDMLLCLDAAVFVYICSVEIVRIQMKTAYWVLT